MKRKFLLGIFFFCFTGFLFAQELNPEQTALRYLNDNLDKYGLTASDINDYLITDMYQSKHNGVTHVYCKQRHQGIEVYNAIFNINILPSGKVFHTGNNFVSDLATKINGTVPQLTANGAVATVLAQLNIANVGELNLIGHPANHKYLYDKAGLAESDIQVQLNYFVHEDQPVLAWNVIFEEIGSQHWWDMQIDAYSGTVLQQRDIVIHCSFHPKAFAREGNNHVCDHPSHQHSTSAQQESSALAGSYNVFAEVINGFLFPHESPSHGDRNILTDPEDLNASPFGWHDTNGAAGPEYTITRGNNVHAYLDVNDGNISQGDEPDGGISLNFDFPYDPDNEPAQQQDAAVTNLFFMNNYMHDFVYAYGMDEVGGNFQQNNYGNGGNGGDYVEAQAQDGGGINNANFATPPDGNNPRMQMYLWNANLGDQFLTVNAPASVEGTYTTGLGFGASITTTPVTGQVVEVEDGVEDPFFTDACETITNDIAGKVALIDRGGCEFGFKALAAENLGAIGVIICNFEDAVITMGAGAVGAQVTIPVVMITSPDCQAIRQFIGNGLEVSFVVPPTGTGPSELDGDFDNGIIAHEFGHGISNRLTGGPNTTSCLGGNEQMGEGWSDFFSLVTSVKPGDTGEMKRGIGTYVQREDTDGNGIRPFVYSTDMDLNPATYSDAQTVSVPHGVGNVWCVMIWDMYWAFVDEYGFDEDIVNGSGGNNMAVQLVMDGMKLQPCAVGFVSGRDAILAADEALYNGENQCLIWDVFARRGVGYTADEGTVAAIGDETEDFDPLPICIGEIRISKSVTPFIQAGDDINVTLVAANYKTDDATGVTVTDEIPDGTTVDMSSISNGGTVQGNMVSWDLGTMTSLQEIELTYTLNTDPLNFSVRYFFDDLEDGEDNWDAQIGAGSFNWEFLSDASQAYSGENYWYVEGVAEENSQTVFLDVDVTVVGDQPVFRFFHQYDTEAGSDGGFIQISTDGGATYASVTDNFVRNGYTGGIPYSTIPIPNLVAFSGNSDGYIPSYVDLSAYAGQDVRLRFRWVSDDDTNQTVIGGGWWLDDVEFMDMINYNGEACISSDQGDSYCVIAKEKGTIVDSQDGTVDVQNIDENTSVQIFPNPANDFITVTMETKEATQATISLISVSGAILAQQAFNSGTQQMMSIPVDHLPSGLYIVEVQTSTGAVFEKVMVE